MNDVPRFSEALEGYGDLAADLLKKWTPFAKDAATKADDGTYSQSDAETDFPAFAKLVTDSMFLLGAEGIRAWSIMTGDFSETHTTGGLSTGTADASKKRTLTVKADFVSVTGKVLPKARITVAPAALAPNETEFSLVVNEQGLKARTYDGTIVVTDTDGGTQEYPESVTVG